MGEQRIKEEKNAEKPTGEKVEKKEDTREEKDKPKVGRITKKWKGKDWFAILSPKAFGENIIAETPATDPKTLMGRTIDVNVSDVMSQKGKDYQRLIFKIIRVDGKNAHTTFSGYVCMKEFISRVIRKHLQKVEVIGNVKTKDEWELQMSSIAIMNRNVEKNIQRKIRLWVADQLTENAGKSGIDEFVKYIATGSMQYNMKKQGSKIYPIRFFEVSKIEVVKVPEK
jgi:small subunit ribosomal protein S3Ae